MRETLRLVWVLIAIGAAPAFSQRVMVTPDATAAQYCSTFEFPDGWQMAGSSDQRFSPSLDYESEFEFRVPGLLETKFMVRGLTKELRDYSTNIYLVDLANPKAIPTAASAKDWEAGTPLNLIRRGFRASTAAAEKKALEGSTRIRWSGDRTGGAEAVRYSQDRVWLVAQSWTAQPQPPMPFGDLFPQQRRLRGKVFFDVYQADSAKRVFQLSGEFFDLAPEKALAATGWLTERYFIIPIGSKRERMLVCDAARFPKVE